MKAKNNREEVSASFLCRMKELHARHLNGSNIYRSISKSYFKESPQQIVDLPFIPASLFKSKKLISVKDCDVYQVLTSSGTGKQGVSKIYLDKENSLEQRIALAKGFTERIGLKRPNILIVDYPSVLNRNSAYTARKAGVVGFSGLCRNKFFALRDDGSIDYESISRAKESENGLVVFGFTYLVWQALIERVSVQELCLDNSVLIHGGGWKKMEEIKVGNKYFKSECKKKGWDRECD